MAVGQARPLQNGAGVNFAGAARARLHMSTLMVPAVPNLRLFSMPATNAGIRADVLQGLQGTPKRLPPRLFYDAHGARLFQALCDTEAYYPTRVETSILVRNAAALAEALGPVETVIEPGAGELRKIRLLLPEVHPPAYLAIDVSGDQLFAEAARLAREYPWLAVTALAGDFGDPRVRQHIGATTGRRVLFFPGSTLGNFEPEAALGFVRDMRSLTGQSGACVIGIDLVKSADTLQRAYDDPEGITARFNLNLLSRINRELSADFDLSTFAHRAFYDAQRQRVEMHLVSLVRQRVCVAGASIAFEPGESIHTENSYKYHPAQFESMARGAGFAQVRHWTDSERRFAVFLLH